MRCKEVLEPNVCVKMFQYVMKSINSKISVLHWWDRHRISTCNDVRISPNYECSNPGLCSSLKSDIITILVCVESD